MNRSWNALPLLYFFVLLAAFGALIDHGPTRAATIDATVKLSICGNEVIEGGEDCEGSNLNGSSCATVGYTDGTLSCDIACTFDKTSCFTAIAPTTAPVSSATNTDSFSESIGSDSAFTAAPPTSVIPSQAIPARTLPPELQFFDYNGTGRISKNELPVVVKLWINEWKQNKRCDINGDGTCDMKDFSVLMYYVDPA